MHPEFLALSVSVNANKEKNNLSGKLSDTEERRVCP